MAGSRARTWSLAASAATLAMACNQLLGVEDANVDARLSGAGRGTTSTAGMASTVGGTGASAGLPSVTTGGAGAASATGGHGANHSSGTAGDDTAGGGGEDGMPHEHGTGGSTSTSMGGSHSGSGSAGKDASENGGEAGDNGGPSGDPCDDYCDEMQSECTGEAEQYRDRAQCMKICHFFPLGDNEGEGNADDDNSVACRLKYVKKTHYGLGAEVTQYCRQAGPSGDGTCGTDCEAFCSVMMAVCTEDTAGPNHFPDAETCLATCNGLPAPPSTVHYSNTDPAVSDGNHALCRLFHVNSAAMADAEEHCEHAMGITLCQATP